MAHIVVVGAGIAGLTCAFRLQEAGHRVQVFEARPWVGGRMTSLDWEGFRINPGAQYITGVDAQLLEMTRAMGLEGELRTRGGGFMLAILRDGRIWPVDFMSVRSYLGWKGVSLKARLAMVKLVPHLLRYRGGDPYRMDLAPGDDRESYRTFFERDISAEMFDCWAYPTFETNCSYEADDLSRKAFCALLGGYLGAKTYFFASGIGALTAAFAARLEVKTSTPVRRLRDAPGGRLEVVLDDGVVTADKVVLAVPGTQVLPLIEAPRRAWSDFFPHVHYSSVMTQFHVFDAPGFDPQVAPAEGVMMTRRQTDIGVAFIYFAQRQANRWLVLTEPRAGRFDSSTPDDQQLAAALAEVTKVYPALAGRRTAARQFPWPEKVPTFRPGYLDRLGAFLRAPDEDPVFFCGDFLAGPGTGAALSTGWRTSDRVLASLKTS